MALVALDYCPEKLAPLVRPLMDTLKRDANKILQVSRMSLELLRITWMDVSEIIFVLYVLRKLLNMIQQRQR